MNVLIITPLLALKGGVSNYFNVIHKYLKVNHYFFEVGSSGKKDTFTKRVYSSLKARNRLRRIISTRQYPFDLVHVNPSFHYAALMRDGLLLNYMKQQGIPVVVFFHGWNSTINKLVYSRLRRLFLSIYGKVDGFVVLSAEFKDQLLKLGIERPILVETTPVDDALIKGYDQEERRPFGAKGSSPQVLFLARVIKEKGIIESILATEILSTIYPSIKLVVAGDGSFLESARRFTKERGLIDRVRFLGYVQGKEKVRAFKESDIYLLPSVYGEGMPTSLLEAMALGLPVVTRPVGGIKDFFQDGKHGFLTKSTDPNELAVKIRKLLASEKRWQEISSGNHQYACFNFLASAVAKRLERFYCDTVERALLRSLEGGGR